MALKYKRTCKSIQCKVFRSNTKSIFFKFGKIDYLKKNKVKEEHYFLALHI